MFSWLEVDNDQEVYLSDLYLQVNDITLWNKSQFKIFSIADELNFWTFIFVSGGTNVPTMRGQAEDLENVYFQSTQINTPSTHWNLGRVSNLDNPLTRVSNLLTTKPSTG